MTVHLTPAQAAKLGLTPTVKARRTRSTVPASECLTLRCVACGESLPRPVDADRHFDANPTHRRQEAIL